MGLFDDSKYVDELEEGEEGENKKGGNREESQQTTSQPSRRRWPSRTTPEASLALTSTSRMPVNEFKAGEEAVLPRP